MSAKPTKRNWNDVQTAIAAAAIVTTLGMWNLFSAPGKTAAAQQADPTLPPTEPPTQPPTDGAVSPERILLPYVKIMFTPGAPQVGPTTVAPQAQQPAPKKKRNRNSGGGGGGGSPSSPPVSRTKSS